LDLQGNHFAFSILKIYIVVCIKEVYIVWFMTHEIAFVSLNCTVYLESYLNLLKLN